MKKFLRKVSKSFRGGQKGFTLIELLIVIVILGVLAAAIIPNLSKFVGSGNVGAANAELASIRTAVSAYGADNSGAFPCAVQPVAGTPQPVVNASLSPAYVTGGIKGTYEIDYTGKVLRAQNGTWPLTIIFKLEADATLHWAKGTAANGTTYYP
jgi:type IV pilus assembly protein PilA